MPKISIIIRTKNEEKWINACLQSVFQQQYQDFEVILLDDHSEDMTLEIASRYKVKIFHYDQPYLPGRALNTGIQQAEGEYIVCLSGHCVPVNSFWLGNLIKNFNVPEVAAVYGRQEPLPYSTYSDKRDLWTIFGLDKKIQKKDSFFHNANSMIRRDLWEQFPFDENTTNIEDRIWAKTVLERKFCIVYEPEASVFHWHGIHQNRDETRLQNVVKILESMNLVEIKSFEQKDLSKLNITAVIPIKGDSLKINGNSLLSYSVERAVESDLINNVIVSTDSENTAELACSLGADTPFLRPKELSYDYVGLNQVMSYTISQLNDLGQYPDFVIILEETHPFRPKGFMDELIREMIYTNVDTLIPAYEEYKTFYKKEKNGLIPIDQGFIPKKFKEPLFAGIAGLGILVKPEILLEERLTGNNVGVFPVPHKLSPIEIHDEEDATYFKELLKDFWTNNE